MKKLNKFFNFKKNKNSIISIVALVECLLILVLTTFSWIETMSSLRIKGEDLIITNGINHNFRYVNDSKQIVDLSTYFNDTARFSFAKASSADGENFYFARPNGTYRLGDTTDFNTTYYNFDFNLLSSQIKFFFKSAEIFSFEENVNYIDSDGNSISLTDDQKNAIESAFLKAFRIAVSTGSSEDTTKIFSQSGVKTSAVKNGSVTTDSQTSTAFESCVFTEETAQTSNNYVFQGSGSKLINIKIWFEEKDTTLSNLLNSAAYSSLKDSILSSLLGANVSINLQFVGDGTEYSRLTFNDFSLSTTDTNSKNKMYFCYDNGSQTFYYPMMVTSTNEDFVTWVTCDDSDTPGSLVPDDYITDVTANPAKGHFFYGSVNASGTVTEVYSWPLSDDNNNANSYTYNALSLTKTSDTQAKGIGYWDDYSIKSVEFVDKATASVPASYNTGAYQFISDNRLYVSCTGITTPIKMNYHKNGDIYRAYILKDSFDEETDSITYRYTNTDYYNLGNVKVNWAVPFNESTNSFTALGYKETGLVDNLTKTAVGIGTYEEVKRINFSAELIDSTVLSNPDYRFRVGFNSTYEIYMATDASNPLEWYAYVPNSVEEVSFRCYNGSNLGTINADWSSCETTISNTINTFYATKFNGDASKGLWNLVVLVDGTTDNLVNFTLTNSATTGAKLKYNDGVNDIDISTSGKIDNFRFITDEIPNSCSAAKFTWTAYDNINGYKKAEFDYTINFPEPLNGIYYYTVTEGGSAIQAN